jgi:HD domain
MSLRNPRDFQNHEFKLLQEVAIHLCISKSAKNAVSHLLAVVSIVLEFGGTENEAIAALPHDAIKDQGGRATAKMIDRLFGPEVVSIVRGCSDTDRYPKPPWRQRKEAYISHLAEAAASVVFVCAADKLANARSLLRGGLVALNCRKEDLLWLQPVFTELDHFGEPLSKERIVLWPFHLVQCGSWAHKNR